MQTDRTTKVLLALIALALFLNAAGPLVQPQVVHAQDTSQIEAYLRQILDDAALTLRMQETRVQSVEFLLGRIYAGTCPNSNIC